MVWDATLPTGSEAKSNGDNRIRELKTDIATALTTEGSFPGADTANPKFRWTPPRGNTASRPASPVTGQLYLNTETKALERYNGATWDAIDTSGGDAASLAGSGLTNNSGTLDVNTDGTTLEINTDTLRVKDSGISAAKLATDAVETAKIKDANVTEAKLSTSVAGSGLAGGGGSALSVNIDDSTIEINADTLRVKDAGVTEAKLATAVVNKLGQNIGLVALTTSDVSYSGQGRLRGVCAQGGTGASVTIVIDGVTVVSGLALGAGDGAIWSQTGIDPHSTGTLASLDIHFKTSLAVTKVGGTGTMTVAYERAA